MWPSVISYRLQYSGIDDAIAIKTLHEFEKEALDALIQLPYVPSVNTNFDAIAIKLSTQSTSPAWKFNLSNYEELIKNEDIFPDTIILVVRDDDGLTTSFKHPFKKWNDPIQLSYAIIRLQFHAQQHLEVVKNIF
tara:strand:- start:344 stop:748 length:405 start_codon:yes stop_codon:yes gene_type:complete